MPEVVRECSFSRALKKRVISSLDKSEELKMVCSSNEHLANAENLILGAEGSNCLLGKSQNVRELVFKNSSTSSSVVQNYCTTIVFPLLETMLLSGLNKLEEICDIDGPISEVTSTSSSLSNYSFKNLKKLQLADLPALNCLWKTSRNVISLYTNLSSIAVEGCPGLLNLYPLSTATNCFPQLEHLRINECGMMDQVFSWNEEAENGSRHITITFPKLKRLELLRLPNLRGFYKGIESIEFPLLTDIKYQRLPTAYRWQSVFTTEWQGKGFILQLE